MRPDYVFLATFSRPFTQCANANFYLKDKWTTEDFFPGWDWETKDGPTHGRVNFVNQAEAITKNLSYVENNTFVMRADNRPRPSLIPTLNAYGDSIVVLGLDIAHMPAECATWPGFRTKSQRVQSSASGVIDIIEVAQSVNLYEKKIPTELPSAPFATLPSTTTQDVVSPSPKVVLPTPFNINVKGDGYYIMVRSRMLAIRVYFLPRDNSIIIPPEIRECGLGEGLLYPDPGPQLGYPRR
ncbi:hypothetical protein F5888DRAFT_1802105 [Russula emetica]|nr:hypothetical protein F5888DRAFT_1802105 [Russula emetica]